MEISTQMRVGPLVARVFLMQHDTLLAQFDVKGTVGNEMRAYFSPAEMDLPHEDEASITLVGSRRGSLAPVLEVASIQGPGFIIEGPIGLRESTGPVRSFVELEYRLFFQGKGPGIVHATGTIEDIPFKADLVINGASTVPAAPDAIFLGGIQLTDPPKEILRLDCVETPVLPAFLRATTDGRSLVVSVICDAAPKADIDTIVVICGRAYRLLGYCQ